jgi:hypothetical protein
MLFFEFMLTKLFKISKEKQTFKQLNTQIRYRQPLKYTFTTPYKR